MSQLAKQIEPVAPLQGKPRIVIDWMGFTHCTTFDEAERIFEKRHGHPPRTVVRDGAIVKAGPIGEEG